jgi:hypothetical protein
LATALDVVNNFAFLPHRRALPSSVGIKGPVVNVNGLDHVVTNMLTLCNAYVSVFTAALACPVPPRKANQQLEWLASNEGKMAGWTECARLTAIARAALGYPVVAAAMDAPHGHIAMVMPSPTKDSDGAYVSAAGARNFVFDKLERSFGAVLAAKCRFFTHN